MGHAGHGTQVCQYGVVHARCRCLEDKVINVSCPTPEVCSALPLAGPPKHRRDIEPKS